MLRYRHLGGRPAVSPKESGARQLWRSACTITAGPQQALFFSTIWSFTALNTVRLGQVTPFIWAPWTFGEQVEADSHAILSQSLARGVNFIDTARMAPCPPGPRPLARLKPSSATGFAKEPSARQKKAGGGVKGSGAHRGHALGAQGKGMTAADIVASMQKAACRRQTDVIRPHQIHWPERLVPAFGNLYLPPKKRRKPQSRQLEALAGLCEAGKEFSLHRPVNRPTVLNSCAWPNSTACRGRHVQNPYCLISRTWKTGWMKPATAWMCVAAGLFAQGFGLLTGKYDESGITGPNTPQGRAHCIV